MDYGGHVFTDDRPLFLQLADRIADDIAAGNYPEETAVPSATEFAVFFHLNPATVSKGVNQLVDIGVLYKKRGIGIFVATGAKDTLRQIRLAEFERTFIDPLLDEARLLGIESKNLNEMISNREKEDHS